MYLILILLIYETRKTKMHTTKDSIKECVSTIPETGDSKAFKHRNSGSILVASEPSIITKPPTPFFIPLFIRLCNFGISEDPVATISLPIWL